MSYYTMFFIGAAPIGHLGAGWLAEAIGAPNTFLVGGAISLLAGLAFALQLPAPQLLGPVGSFAPAACLIPGRLSRHAKIAPLRKAQVPISR